MCGFPTATEIVAFIIEPPPNELYSPGGTDARTSPLADVIAHPVS